MNKKISFFQNNEEKENFMALVNESNTLRIKIFAPFMILFMCKEIISDSLKFIRNQLSPVIIKVPFLNFEFDAYVAFAILDVLIILLSSVSIFLNFKENKFPDKYKKIFFNAIQVYGIAMIIISVLVVLIDSASNHEADFSFYYFIGLVFSAIFYIHPAIFIPEIILSNVLMWIIIEVFKLNSAYSPYMPYHFFILAALCVCSYFRFQYLLFTLRREEKIKKFSEEAEIQNHLKSLFLANMSHEIRTPMNAIIGMSELALDFDLEDSEKNTLRQIRSSGLALVNIINDILDFSKIESGKMEIVNVNYDLLKMVYDAANVAKVKVQGKNVELVIEMDPELSTMYNGDDLRLRQVIINLMGNAAKFTEKGFIIIRIENLKKYETREGLKFSIIDSGIGIKNEDLKKLFNAFQQVDMKMNRTKEGTGLGLSISKKLVQLMGGNLGVESEYGKGSCFYFNLPQKTASEKKVGESYKLIFDKSVVNKRHPELRNLGLDSLLNQKEFAGLFAEKSEKFNFICPDAKILVVDDNEVNLQVATGLLKKFGVVPDTALSGFDALVKLKNSEYDIIFLDHQMPGMDGVETLQKIRSNEKLSNKHSIVVALSANAVNGAKEMFLKNDFDDFVSKPVQGKDFGECLKKWLNPVLLKENNSVENEISIPENFIRPDEGKLNLNDAVERAGSFENWLAAAKTFYSSVQNKAYDIENFLKTKDFKNYTISVHALKSSAKIIGADELSDRAKNLEALGNRIQSLFENTELLVEEIEKKNSELLYLYRSYREILKDSVHFGEKSDDEKNKISSEKFKELIAKLKNSAEENNLSDAETAFKELSESAVPSEIKDKISQLSDAVENIDFDEVLKIINEI